MGRKHQLAGTSVSPCGVWRAFNDEWKSASLLRFSTTAAYERTGETSAVYIPYRLSK